MFRSRLYLGKIVLLLADGLFLCLALFFALKFRYWFSGDHWYSFGRHIVIFGPHFLLWLCLFYWFDLYNLKQIRSAAWNFSVLTFAMPINLALSVLLFYFFPTAISPKSLLLLTGFFGLLFFLFSRYVYARSSRDRLAKRLIVLGDDAGRAAAVATLAGKSENSYRLLGFVWLTEPLALPESLTPRLGEVRNLAEIFRQTQADRVVCLFNYYDNPAVNEALLGVLDVGGQVMDWPSFYEEATGKIPLEAVDTIWFLQNIYGFGKIAATIKRVGDLLLSGSLLLLTWPLWFLLAAVIKIDSDGPVFYTQVRVGERERPFRIYKFRSMRADAEKLTGAVWAGENDPRVTRVGRLLRLSRLDELPQLWNIWCGEMSFVGPRPERPEFVAKLKANIPFYGRRHLVKPGLTGWAQIRYRYGASEQDALEKLQYDFFYLKNKSLLLDLMIIVRTARVIFTSEGR